MGEETLGGSREQAPRRSREELLEELRRLRASSPESRDRRQSILHEISVYQEELIVQNEELIQAQVALEQTRDRFIELYDFAPNGYLTLDANGLIRQCNLTAASLLGKAKHALEGLPFLGFVTPDDRNAYFDFLRQCRRGEVIDIETELTIQAADGARRVQLLCRPRRGLGHSFEGFVALVDVTEHAQLEREREQIGRERTALASRLISTQDDQRLRIARNLHDDLGQQVTALRLKFEELASAIPNDTTGVAVTQVQEMLHHLDRRLHFVASELRPAALDLGIVAALGQFVREWSETFGVPAAFHSTGIAAGMLTPDVETHLYRIAQEALNNVAKYAAASQVVVLLDDRDGSVVLLVEDDGCGFDLTALRQRGDGLGLVGMRERAQILGGRLEVETVPGNGTSVYVYVPRKTAGGGAASVPSAGQGG
jgi:PAS domain S-box-containing protein